MACEVCPGQFRHYIAPANPNMNDWRTTILHDRGGLKYKWFVIMGSKSTILQHDLSFSTRELDWVVHPDFLRAICRIQFRHHLVVMVPQ